jgi:hypothetical protein
MGLDRRWRRWSRWWIAVLGAAALVHLVGQPSFRAAAAGGGGASAAPAALAVGGPAYELGLTALPARLLGAYCRDLSEGRSHESGRVASQLYGRWYTVLYLESINLYGRMDRRLASTGGCAAYADQYSE